MGEQEKKKVDKEEKAKKKEDAEVAEKEAARVDKEEKAQKEIEVKKAKVEEEKKKAEQEEEKNPAPGSKFTSAPVMLNTDAIKAGEPCKVMLQESEDRPWEFRGFEAPQKCEDGYICGKTRDIAAISYFKSDSDESTEISGTVYYCAAK